MRVAVCISGACRTKRKDWSLTKNMATIRSKFPTADFYFATWDNDNKQTFNEAFPNEKCSYFPEPHMHYHPYDIPQKNHISTHYSETTKWVKAGGIKRMDWAAHHTKQILIHSWLCEKILSSQYDVLVRTRFDIYISKNANFTDYLNDTFNNHRANCFGTKGLLFDQIHEVTKDHPMYETWMIDGLIIHPSGAIDVDSVNTLHRDKQLHAAEYGWYQVIGLPHGTNHRTHNGWVSIDNNVADDFLWT